MLLLGICPRIWSKLRLGLWLTGRAGGSVGMTPAGRGKASRPMWMEERFPALPKAGGTGRWSVGGVTFPGVTRDDARLSDDDPAVERGGMIADCCSGVYC